MSDEHRNWQLLGSQDLQRSFDISRGFDELPYSSSPEFVHPVQTKDSAEDPDRFVSKLEFATLGALGELGEFAGLVKRWRRERGVGQKPEPQSQELAAELGDIYAYVLKMANVLGRDLEQVHLERMIRNIIRFETKSPRSGISIAIAGPSCVGKTTAVTNVSKILGATISATYIEKYENNIFLAALLRGEDFDCDQSQKWFLNEYLHFFGSQIEKDNSTTVVDQEPSAVAMVYSYEFYKDGRLDSQSYTNHLKQYLSVEDVFAARAVRRKIILLDAPPNVLYQRSLARKQSSRPPLSWFSGIRDRFFHVYRGLPNVICLDTADLSITEMSNAVAELIKSICDGERVS